jgi:osomolarity two-component system response regulator SSK1
MLCTFEIVHNISPTPLKSPAETPKAETPMFAGNDVERDEPDFNTLLCRRILRHVNATLHSGLVEESPPLAAGSVIPPPRRTYELAVLLATGQPIIEPTILSAEEQAARQPFPSLRLAREPTLNELADFAETLRGKRVELHASLKSLFARHLTSYLAAWGMDIRHTPIEECDENEAMRVDTSNMSGLPTSSQDSGYGGGAVGGRSQTQESAAALRTGAIDLDQPPAEQIIIIDDDVGVLKKQLLKIRAESPVLSMRSRNLKRPALSLRAKSSPQVRSLQAGVTAGKMPQPIRPSNSVVIHFTSISRYNHVRDVVAGILAISPEASFYQPEVMVIPKPVGPRRFLTALHTALDRPIVDPYFSPIATSPRSPGGSYFSAKPSRAPSAFDGMGASHFSAVPEEVYEGDVLREPSDDSIAQVKVKSPNMEGNASTGGLSPSARFQDPTHLQIATPSGEIVATSAMEYFSEAVSKLGSSAASGLLVQSPDGRPVGMYFDPPSRGEGRRPSQAKADTRRRSSIRGTTPVMEQGAFGAAVGTSPTSRRHSLMSSGSHHDTVESRRSSTLQDLPDEDDGQTSKGARRDSRTSNASTSSRRKTTITTITPPSAPRNRDRSSTVTGAGQGGGARSPSPTPSKQGDASKVLPAPPLESPYNVADSALNSLPKVGSKKAAAIEAKLAAKAKAAEETAAAIAKVAAPKKAASKDGVVVPPINVLIVEGALSMRALHSRRHMLIADRYYRQSYQSEHSFHVLEEKEDQASSCKGRTGGC